jgi:predicted RNase H-like nuclease
VLGIDAAWTVANASGVGLLCETAHGWKCLAVAPSYQAFLRSGADLSLGAVLRKAKELTSGSPVTVIAADIPISRARITGRRAADNLVSKAFGSAGCGTHSPSPTRPGVVSTALLQQARQNGYELATVGSALRERSLIEVYPHPALLSLCSVERRMQYKIGKSKRYWPEATLPERRSNIIHEMHKILNALRRSISLIPLELPADNGAITSAQLKMVEDQLDALVCCWVGMQFLCGKAQAYGDTDSAIWIPYAYSKRKASIGSMRVALCAGK